MRCKACSGSGKVLGGGMITRDCYECHGTKYVAEPIPNKVKIKRSSKVYKDAIKKIKELDINITDDQAKKLFQEELDRVENGSKLIAGNEHKVSTNTTHKTL